MPVGMPRTKSAHGLKVLDTAHWNGMVPVSHYLPSKVPQLTPKDEPESCPSSIDEVPVLDDPREWSQRRKLVVLLIVAYAAVAPYTGVFIYQPAIENVQSDLHATTNEIALSLSLFILVQGVSPLLWSSVSDIKGRKFIYISSMLIFVIGSAAGGFSQSIGVLICMRMLQAVGSSAVSAIGSGTLADIYAPHERGTMMGIYYAAPLLGPSLGPLLGGVVTNLWNWRATFYLLTILGAIALFSFFFFTDTFRRERSLTYQAAKERATERALRKAERQLANQAGDPEKSFMPAFVDPSAIEISILDVNPLTPIWSIFKRKNNLFILLATALLFAFQYSVYFTASITFSEDPYNFNPLQIGFVLLSFGLGTMFGNIAGGRWSDHCLSKLKENNEGKSIVEMRLESTKLVMLIIPPTVVAYAWVSAQKQHWAGAVVILFVSGFGTLFIYASALAYLVDANPGRSIAATASNSSLRGFAGMVSSEMASPLLNTLGDGGLYSIWAGLLVIMELMILLVIWKGQQWREAEERKEQRRHGT